LKWRGAAGGPQPTDRHTRPAQNGKNSLCCALLKCASFFYFKMCIIVSCSARATSAWCPAAGLSRPAPAEPPCAGALRWRGPVGSRPWPGRRRWARAAASDSGSRGSVVAAWGKQRARDKGALRPRFSPRKLGSPRGPPGLGLGSGAGPHLTGLCSVATGSGLSWDSGAAARPGESPASMGNLRPCGGSWALMSGPGALCAGSGGQAAGPLCPRPPPGPLLTCRRPRPRPVPG
jgi:hypothetical protein